MALNEGREVLKLRDDELEELIKKWIANEVASYVDFDRNSGAGDRGLDAVGFLTKERYAGAWHNYQCKQLSVSLGEASFFAEVGKVIYYASEEEFSLPERYIFVAPRGIAGNVRRWIGMPSNLKKEMLSNWSLRAGRRIVANVDVPMTAKLNAYINRFDFSCIEGWNVHKLVEQPRLRKILHEHVDIDPGSAPAGIVPQSVSQSERPYVSQLIGVYGDHVGMQFADETSVFSHPNYGPHLRDQRRRYHDADAFRRHFRDNVPDGVLAQFKLDIYDGVVDEYRSLDGYSRVNAIMKTAGSLNISGIFQRHSRAPVSVKQGTCHHLANDGDLPWK